jgi:tetratricopeptide (TPR) repeat protein
MRIMKKILLIFMLALLVISLYSQETTPGETPKEDALILYRNGQYERAIEVCREELKVYGPDQVNKKLDSYTVMCWSLIRLQRYDEVIKTGKEALSVFSYDQRIIETMGEAYFFKGDNLNALKYFEQYAVLNPTGQWIQNAYYYMGEIYIRLGEFAHADIAFSTAIYHSPNIAGWWSRLGYAMEMQENSEGAMEAYRQAVKLQPGQEDALLGIERLQAN